MRILMTFFLICFALISLSIPSTQRLEQTQGLQHEVTVTLKLIQVYVTDKKGNPAVNLKKEDFVIYDNGKKQSITEFEQHILSLPSIEEKVQPEIIQESKLPAPPELMNRKFFLFFDFAYNNAKGILKAKEAALHFMDTQLQPSDEVGLLSYSAINSLTLHEYLTTNHMKIRQVVESFGEKEIHGRAENFEIEYWRAIMGENPLDVSKRGGVFDKGDKRKEVLDSERRESRFQAHHFFPKMIDLAKSLRYIPGYKHVILFSSGVPYSIMYGTQSFSSLKYGFENLGDPNLREGYEDMLKELSASNSAVYVLDTEELRARIGVDTRVTGVFTLQKMSSATGGKYFGNVNNYERHLEKIQDLTGCFYVLGYYIDEKWDGKYHKIKVKVNRPGCKIYSQKGYFNPKPFTEYNKTEKTIHLVDLALSEKPLFQTPVRFPLAALSCLIKGKPNVELFSKINMENIQELSSEDVEVVSIIFDNKDNIIKIERNARDFSKLPIGNIYHSSLLPLDPGEYKCRVVIRNLQTGKGAVASSSIKIPENPDYGLQLDTPLLLKRERNASYLQKLSPVYPFDSSLYSPLVGELERGTKRIFAVLRCSILGIQQPDIQLSANLILLLADTEKNIPTALSILNRHQEEGTEIFLIELQTEELQSGEYFLCVFAEDKLTQSRSDVNTTFKVK